MAGKRQKISASLERDQKKIRLLGFLLLFLLVYTYITSPKPQLAKTQPKKVLGAQTHTTQLVSSLSADLLRFITPTPTAPAPTPTVTPTVAPKPYCLDVPILMYHHVEPIALAKEQGHDQLTVDSGIFESQIQHLLAHGYVSLSLSELVDALERKLSLPTKSVVLTFDDGYDDMYYFVYPLLSKYHLKGNFMLSTGLLGTTDYLTWEQIIQMKENTQLSFYNHTVHHIALPTKDRITMEYEIKQARTELQGHLQTDDTIFAYPYGSFTDETTSLLKALGFRAAITTSPGIRNCDTDLFTLKRVRIGNVPLASYNL